MRRRNERRKFEENKSHVSKNTHKKTEKCSSNISGVPVRIITNKMVDTVSISHNNMVSGILITGSRDEFEFIFT